MYPSHTYDKLSSRILVVAHQIGVSFRARSIAGVCQTHHALMFDVAIRAARSECLFRMMDRPIVTRQASLIGGSPLKASLRHMARAAFLADQRVCTRDRSRIIRFRISSQPLPAQPREPRGSQNQ